MRKIKLALVRWLLRNEDYLLTFHNVKKGGGSILVEDDENDYLRRVAKEAMEHKPTICNFFLTVSAEFLQKHPDLRLKFSKHIYNTDSQ